MKSVDIHVALEVCEIVIESATILAILEAGSKKRSFRRVAATTDAKRRQAFKWDSRGRHGDHYGLNF
jgi:hypothetical protein